MDRKVDATLFKKIIEEIIPFNKLLGLKLLEIQEGLVSVKIPFRQELIGDPRRPALHGGVIASILDVVGGAVAMTTLHTKKDHLVTIDLRVDYLQPGTPQDIFAEGIILKSGDRIIFTRMHAFQGNIKNIIAEARGVYHVHRNEYNH